MKKFVLALILSLYVFGQGMAYAVPCFVSGASDTNMEMAEVSSSAHDCCPDSSSENFESDCLSLSLAQCQDEAISLIKAVQVEKLIDTAFVNISALGKPSSVAHLRKSIEPKYMKYQLKPRAYLYQYSGRLRI